MPRFYISDGARPGRRTPALDYATKVNGVGSDILNEAQAIARGRKLTATAVPATPTPAYRYWRVRPTVPLNGAGSPVAWLLAELRMRDAAGTNLALSATPIMSGVPSWGGPLSVLKDGSSSGGIASPEHTDRDCTTEWFGYDFGVPMAISTVEAVNYLSSAAYSVSAFNIEGSSNGTTWTLVKAASGLPVSAGSVQTVTAVDVILPPYVGTLLTPTNLIADNAQVIKGAQYGSTTGAAWKVFDGSSTATWFSYDVANTWVGYDFGVGVTTSINKYKMFGSGSHWPSIWMLESSNNGTTWTLVDTSPVFYVGWNERTGYAAPAPARYWRVRTTDNVNEGDIANREVGALELWGN